MANGPRLDRRHCNLSGLRRPTTTVSGNPSFQAMTGTANLLEELEGDLMSLGRLLGPVDVVGDDGTVHQSASALRRALLALLGIHAGRVLSSDWLLELIWGDEQPDSGIPALSFHISQLRKEIGAVVSIVTRPAGYQLDVSRSSVDALIFDDQAHEARAEVDD